ncbi:MAG TPA: hypothetical protein PKL31_12175 [Fulvivirga sp.]|nr:hypothetical protein [Fulvivirga sp.]
MKKTISYFLLMLSVFALSCNSDEDSSQQFSVEEAKQSMSKLSTDMSLDIVDLTQSEGVGAIGDLAALIQLSDPFNGRVMSEKESKKWFKKNARLFKRIFVGKSSKLAKTEDHGFDFSQHWGQYDWNPATETFDKTETTEGIIEINFPAEGSAANNVTLRLTAFEEQLFEDEFDHYYLPTLLNADLSVNKVKQIEIDFEAVFNSKGEPISGDVSLYLNPFTFVFAFDTSGAKQSNLEASIMKGSETIVSVNAALSFLTDQKEDIDNIDGFVQYKTIKLEGSIDVNGLENSNDPNPNTFVKLAMFNGGNKIGDIIFVTEVIDQEEEDVPYIKYTDGTTEKLEDVLKPIFDELDNLEMEIENWDIG